MIEEPADRPRTAGSSFVHPAPVRSGFVIATATVVGLALASGPATDGRTPYLVSWGAVAMVGAAASWWLASAVVRQTVGPDRVFWRRWRAGLVPAAVVSAGIAAVGVHRSSGAQQVAATVIGTALVLTVITIWSVSLGSMLREKSGARLVGIDVFDVLITNVGILAPVLLPLIAPLGRSGNLWLAVPAIVAAAGAPGAAVGSVLMATVVPKGERRFQAVGVASVVFGLADAWLQVTQAVQRFSLPSAPLLAVHVLAVASLMAHPLFARHDVGEGLERLETEEHVRSWSVLPFLGAASTLALVVELRVTGAAHRYAFPFVVGSIAVLVLLAALRSVVASVETRHLTATIAELKLRLLEQSRTDALTGIANRRALFDGLRRMKADAARHGVALSVAMIDLDHFKAVNDRHGHAEGDRVLREFAAHLAGGIREVDLVGRYGGEEFAIAFERSSVADAAGTLERLRRSSPVEVAGERVTCSAGLAEWSPGESLEELIARADGALYEAKRAGRDRIGVADPERPGDLLLADPGQA